MKYSSMDLELEDWELLPDDGFLEIHDDAGKKIYSRKYANFTNTDDTTNSTSSVFKMNYFNLSPPKKSNQHHPFPILLQQPPLLAKMIPNPAADQIDVDDEEAHKASSQDTAAVKIDGDQDQIASPQQVFFIKKMKEAEFVDIKVMESPKSPTSRDWIMPQIEGAKEVVEMDDDDDDDDQQGGGMSKWSLSSGIGAIFSFGMVAAATVCVIVFSTQNKNTHKLHFQIFTNDKKMKQAISAVRGVANSSRAEITFGGYYDAPPVSV